MILDIKHVSKNFGGVKALNNCTIKIEKGKITSIIGPNGSGKTTLFNAITSLLDKKKGEIIFKGKNISKLKTYRISKMGLSRTFQDVRLFSNLTINDHINIALSQNDEKLFKSLRLKEDNEDRVKKIIKKVHLDKPLSTLATDLSYGQRKLLDLAVAIAKPHSLLMLDEPVAGVNPKLRKEIKEIVRELNREGETILLIEHDMNFVMDLADHIFVMDHGKVIAQGKPEEIQNNKKVLEAYLGE